MSNVFSNTKCISLTDPAPNGTAIEHEDIFIPLFDALNEIHDRLVRGETVYLGITDGERKGSIAYIKSLDSSYHNSRPHLEHHRDYQYWNVEPQTISRTRSAFICVILGWDKRGNKVKWATHSHTVYLPDYEGPTVWKKFDKKAAAEAILAAQPPKDRDGNILVVGDRVVYINARYGGAASLDRGTIKEIKASVRLYRGEQFPTIHVIIDNDQGDESDIRQSQDSILKLPVE